MRLDTAPPGRRSAPGEEAESAPKSFGGDTPILPPSTRFDRASVRDRRSVSRELDRLLGADPYPTVAELMALADRLRADLDDVPIEDVVERQDDRAAAWIAGREHGFSEGWRARGEDLAAAERHAANIERLDAILGSPPRDDTAATLARAAWWSARRGEGA